MFQPPSTPVPGHQKSTCSIVPPTPPYPCLPLHSLEPQLQGLSGKAYGWKTMKAGGGGSANLDDVHCVVLMFTKEGKRINDVITQGTLSASCGSLSLSASQPALACIEV